MKRLAVTIFCVSLLSSLAAFITFQVIGGPDRSVACDQAALPEYFVCLSTVRNWDESDILWVDARPRGQWEEDGIEGSVLVNDQEDWIDLEVGFMSKMIEQLKPIVVVYCNQSGCGSSKYVANQLREKHAEALGFQVFVLEGGVNALREEK
ncbi:rhodanese-like domain-containing protein [Akkermansiaceae bacterium]|jgi:rhodanese-related sulfurtransferase|nr:rhodanese-like domain-containing protein [Akkermansiaceae bacterium]MDA9830844.1 rhodanese-like domain-containing protein [Akkermansiaceae bacterium]MDF1713680.1 rhodanese-like domain-containing protein [Akkermansiaceae bacterium]